MIDPQNKVLACVDRSRFAVHVADYAAWAANRLNAPLEFLHVIDRHPERSTGDDHSGTIGIDAQQHLLTQLSTEDEQRARSTREQGRIFLKQLRERALAAGCPEVDVRQRHGELEDTLREQQAQVRLMVLGRRGASAEATRRDLGRNVERVVRALRRPVLTVTEGFKPPERVMIAFDGSGVTRRGVEMIAASPLFAGLPIHLLMSGKPRADAPRQLDWARARLETAGFAVTPAWVPGDAETVIARVVQEQSIDLLVMGAFGHSVLRRLILGSKTADLLRSATIPTLLLR